MNGGTGMKKTLKGYFIGFLSAIVLVSGATYAANTTTLYNVIVDGIKIIVDGQKLNPTDVNGNKVEPIIYNGTTYLPVRAVANAIGKAVYWDGPNYTVYLGEMNGALEYPTVELEDMTSIAQEPCSTDELTDNYGNRYERAVINNSSINNFEYLLNMKYSRFKAVLYVPEGNNYEEPSFLKIIADGKTIYVSPEMTKTSRPIEIEIDIKGYNDFKIQFCGEKYYNIALGNAGFYQ